MDIFRHVDDRQEAAECLAREDLRRMSKSNISCLVILFEYNFVHFGTYLRVTTNYCGIQLALETNEKIFLLCLFLVLHLALLSSVFYLFIVNCIDDLNCIVQ